MTGTKRLHSAVLIITWKTEDVFSPICSLFGICAVGVRKQPFMLKGERTEEILNNWDFSYNSWYLLIQGDEHFKVPTKDYFHHWEICWLFSILITWSRKHRKTVQYTFIRDQEKQQVVEFENLESWNMWHFCVKSEKRSIDFKNRGRALCFKATNWLIWLIVAALVALIITRELEKALGVALLSDFICSDLLVRRDQGKSLLATVNIRGGNNYKKFLIKMDFWQFLVLSNPSKYRLWPKFIRHNHRGNF